MAGIIIGSGFNYKGPLRNFERDGFDTLKQLLAFDTDDLPDSFIATVVETGKAYTFSKKNSIDPKLGLWRELANSNDVILKYIYTPDSSLLKVENVNIEVNVGEGDKLKYLQVGNKKLSISDFEDLTVKSSKQNGIKTYYFYKGETLYGRIDFNADLVVKSGGVVKVGSEGMKVVQGLLYKAFYNEYKTIYIQSELELIPGNFYYVKNASGEIIAEGELKRSLLIDNVYIQNIDDEAHRFDISNRVTGSDIYEYITLEKGVYLRLDIANQDWPLYINVKDLGGNYFDFEEVPLINKEEVKNALNEWAMKISGQMPRTIIHEDGSTTTETIDSLYYLDDDKTNNVGVNPKFEDFFKALLTEKEARNIYLACYSEHPYKPDDEIFKDIVGTAKGVYYNTEDKCIYIAYQQIDQSGKIIDTGWKKYSVDLVLDSIINDDYTKYTLKLNGDIIGNIVVPSDLVVSSGEITLLTGDSKTSTQTTVYIYRRYTIQKNNIYLQSGDVLSDGQIYYIKTDTGLFVKGGALTEFTVGNTKYYSILNDSTDINYAITVDSTYTNEIIRLSNGLYLKLNIANREQPVYIDFDKLVVRMTKTHDDENHKTVYQITQGKGNLILDISDIEIPDDRHITNGELINLNTTEAKKISLTEGTYIKLTLTNPTEDIYLNTTDYFVLKLSAAPEIKNEGSTYYNTSDYLYMKYLTATSLKYLTVKTVEELDATGYIYVRKTTADAGEAVYLVFDNNLNPVLIEDQTTTKWRRPYDYEEDSKTLVLY